MKIIGHRGASGNAPENTHAAMDLAIKHGCHGIETDLQLTKDGEVVVFHDWSVERTTNGKGKVKDLTLDELLKLDAGSWFSKEFENEKIPTLEELIKFIPKDLLLNLEIKSQILDNRGIEEKLVKILETNNRIENIVISSFNHKSLERVEKLNPEIKLGLLYEAYFIDPIKAIKSNKLDLYSLHPSYYYIDQELIDNSHRNDLKVYAWTVNDLEAGKKLKDMGVDGLITNFPELFK